MNPFSNRKLLQHLDRLVEWKATGSTRPVVLDLHPTNRCNHNCPACNGFKDNSAEFEFRAIQNVMRDAVDQLGVKAVYLSGGGEPLMHPEAAEIIDYATQRLHVKVGLITNGELLAGDKAKSAQQCEWVRVSLDAGGPERHARTHGTRSWDAVVQNLADFILNRGACTVGISYLLYDHALDIEDLAGALRVTKEVGADYLEVKPLAGRHGVSLETEQYVRVLANVSDVPILCPPSYDKPTRDYDLCHSQHFMMTVTANGDAYRCCELAMKSTEGPYGNVLIDGVSKTWFSNERLRRAVTSCAKCPCPCRNHAANQTLHELFCTPVQHSEFI